MSTTIKCPNCSHEFELNESLREDVKKELRDEMKEWQRKKEDAFNTQLAEERKKIQQETEQSIRKKISSDFEIQLRQLEQNNKDNEEKLKIARQKEQRRCCKYACQTPAYFRPETIHERYRCPGQGNSGESITRPVHRK